MVTKTRANIPAVSTHAPACTCPICARPCQAMLDSYRDIEHQLTVLANRLTGLGDQVNAHRVKRAREAAHGVLWSGKSL
jgi:hypothetical protein